MRVKFIPYVIATFLGTTIRATIIALVGWQVGEVYRVYAHVIDKFEKLILAVIVAAIITYIIYMKRKK
jgi:membrane protein DedA with SNARE-associated domain